MRGERLAAAALRVAWAVTALIVAIFIWAAGGGGGLAVTAIVVVTLGVGFVPVVRRGRAGCVVAAGVAALESLVFAAVLSTSCSTEPGFENYGCAFAVPMSFVFGFGCAFVGALLGTFVRLSRPEP